MSYSLPYARFIKKSRVKEPPSDVIYWVNAAEHTLEIQWIFQILPVVEYIG